MSANKYPQCGFVNWVDAESCEALAEGDDVALIVDRASARRAVIKDLYI